MSWKDKANATRENNDFPKFLSSVNLRVDVKGDDSGKIGFRYYERDEATGDGENKFIYQSVKGVLIGEAMRLEVFDQDLGKNGGTMQSSIFFTKEDKGVCFSMGKNVMKGVINDIKDFMAKESGSVVKTKRIIFLLTEKGTLMEFNTNIVLAIADTKVMDGDYTDNYILLTPKEYVPEEHVQKTKDHLGKFANKNRPKYAHIEFADVIPDTVDGELLSKIFDDFGEFKEFTKAHGTTEEEETEKTQEELLHEAEVENSINTQTTTDAFDKPEDFPKAPNAQGADNEPVDDLPF